MRSRPEHAVNGLAFLLGIIIILIWLRLLRGDTALAS